MIKDSGESVSGTSSRVNPRSSVSIPNKAPPLGKSWFFIDSISLKILPSLWSNSNPSPLAVDEINYSGKTSSYSCWDAVYSFYV